MARPASLGVLVLLAVAVPAIQSFRALANVPAELTPPSCPSHSARRHSTEGSSASCICEEGYEAAGVSWRGFQQRLAEISLEFAGTAQQHWAGECQERTCSAKDLKGYSYLLFEGGGVRGIAYGGAVRALEDTGLLQHVEGFSGASAGSQVAALLAAGYNGPELVDAMVAMDLKSFMDSDDGFAYTAVTSKFGYYKGEALEAAIDGLISKKTGTPHTTFAQLYAHSCKASGACKELKLPALNVNTGRIAWFSAQTTPNVTVARAVRASSAIPLFFQPPAIEMPDGGTYLFVDGGTLRNLPSDAFHVTPDKPALGLAMRANGAIAMEKKASFDGFMPYLQQLSDAILFGPDSANSLDTGGKAVDISVIRTDDVSCTDFKIEPRQKSRLIRSGYNAVMELVNICRRNGMQLKELLAEPEWLLRIQEELTLDQLALEVSHGITNGRFSLWWNLPATKEAFSKHMVYKGDVKKSEWIGDVEKWFSEKLSTQKNAIPILKPRSVEVVHMAGRFDFESNTYIVTHMPRSAGEEEHLTVREVYIAHGPAFVSGIGNSILPDTYNGVMTVQSWCFVLEVQKIKDLSFDKFHKLWQGERKPRNSMTFCGGEEFKTQICETLGCGKKVTSAPQVQTIAGRQ